MIGLYALESNLELAAFAEGLRAAGLDYKYRNHNLFHRLETEDFSLVVLSGLRGKGKEIRDAYTALGVPVVVIDYGYMRRVFGVATWATGHWQVGIGRLGWVPPFQCPDDRFKSLGIDIVPKAQGSLTIVCGQHAGDPSHGLDEEGIRQWALGRLAEHPDALWRPHPDSPVQIEGRDAHNGPIDWHTVGRIVCINSNTGHEALLNGVPVTCEQSASYHHLSGELPSVEARHEYFCRLAYAQWTLDEMREGKTINFITKEIPECRNICT